MKSIISSKITHIGVETFKPKDELIYHKAERYSLFFGLISGTTAEFVSEKGDSIDTWDMDELPESWAIVNGQVCDKPSVTIIANNEEYFYRFNTYEEAIAFRNWVFKEANSGKPLIDLNEFKY